jgi:hypothetical protein
MPSQSELGKQRKKHLLNQRSCVNQQAAWKAVVIDTRAGERHDPTDRSQCGTNYSNARE